MDPHLLIDVDKQILCLQEAFTAANNIKSKCLLLENEKRDALEKCARLDVEIQRLKNAECSNCNLLQRKLNEEKKKREIFQKAEKEKFLKSIEKALESMDDVNTNQMTNAHQLFTQIVVGGLVDAPQKIEKKSISLIDDSNENITDASIVLANETMVAMESDDTEEAATKPRAALVVPETEPCIGEPPSVWSNVHRSEKSQGQCSRSRVFENGNVPKENRISAEVSGIQHTSKKFKCSSISHKNDVIRHSSNRCSPSRPVKSDIDKTLVLEQSDISLSVLSENNEEISASSSRMNKNKTQEEKGTTWKMRPSVLVENNGLAARGRKMKQMTLSVARPEKKHDISLSQAFNGGVANAIKRFSDEDIDVILASPEHLKRKNFQKKPQPRECNTMEDPDMTVFQPAATSTCLTLPAGKLETSFDRLPEPEKSPPYKYRRDTVRKKVDRLKLPGQECDECAKYYEAAGLDKSQDIRHRVNLCSRHRDKYQIRANTPPGFWDPVFPDSPDQS